MKTTIEMHGYEIVIEETQEGLLTISAMKDGEVVESFELEGGEDYPHDEEGSEEMKSFGEEEEDLSGEEEEEEMPHEEEEMPSEEEEEEMPVKKVN
jgi:hypothetical protein